MGSGETLYDDCRGDQEEVNDLSSDSIKSGDKLLIFKENMSIL